MTRKEGYIEVDKMLQQIGVDITNLYTILASPLITKVTSLSSSILFSFVYDGIIYFYKYNRYLLPYSELISSFLLDDFNLPSVDFDLAITSNLKGTISKNFKKRNVHYIEGIDVLTDFYKEDYGNIENYNNLEGIWDALEYRYRDFPNKREIISKLMKRIVNIFIFDIICCNNDRHCMNWCIMEENDVIDIAPVYDNERILSTSGKSAYVSITLDHTYHENLWKSLKKYLKVSSDQFRSLIQEKLWIICDEHLQFIFQKIEDKTGYPMPNEIKQYYLKEFQSHKRRLEKILEKEEMKERDEHYEGKNR